MIVKENLELIGRGGVHSVYKCKREDGSLVALRSCVSDCEYSNMRSIWDRLNDLRIKTTNNLSVCLVGDSLYIETEFLEDKDFVHVTPNTIANNHTGDAEYSCLKRKKKTIANLKPFIEQVINDIDRASEQNLSIYLDAYFFRFNKFGNEVVLDYKIADWDNIKCEEYVSAETNRNFFLKALRLFIIYFIEDSPLKDQYLSIVDSYMSDANTHLRNCLNKYAFPTYMDREELLNDK